MGQPIYCHQRISLSNYNHWVQSKSTMENVYFQISRRSTVMEYIMEGNNIIKQLEISFLPRKIHVFDCSKLMLLSFQILQTPSFLPYHLLLLQADLPHQAFYQILPRFRPFLPSFSPFSFVLLHLLPVALLQFGHLGLFNAKSSIVMFDNLARCQLKLLTIFLLWLLLLTLQCSQPIFDTIKRGTFNTHRHTKILLILCRLLVAH